MISFHTENQFGAEMTASVDFWGRTKCPGPKCLSTPERGKGGADSESLQCHAIKVLSFIQPSVYFPFNVHNITYLYLRS